MLEAYALIARERGHHGGELTTLLHREEHVVQAQQQLIALIRRLLTEAADAGQVRNDVAPQELAVYCLHALAAAASLPSEASVRRLVQVVVSALGPSGWRPGGGPPHTT